MATYNWKYKPNVPNKYSFIIEESDDDVRPNNACYVALFGSDETGNGSRLKPYKNPMKAYVMHGGIQYLIMGSGVFRTLLPGNEWAYITIVGDGDVTIDTSYYSEPNVFESYGGGAANIKFIGNGDQYLGNGQINSNYTDCTLKGIHILNGFNYLTARFSYSVIDGARRGLNIMLNHYIQGAYCTLDHLTFANCNNITNDTYGTSYSRIESVIFYRCNISFNDVLSNSFKYKTCLFYQCNFRFSRDRTSPGGALYPLVPEGYNYINNIDDLKAAYQAIFPEDTEAFRDCKMDDPKFNNPEIGDYSLAFDSPAKNASYFGTYIGAKSIGYPIKARATENEGNFDFSTAVNVSVTDNSIMLINPEIDASIETKVTANLKGRELAEAPIFGFSADRNGQYIDSLADLSEITVSVGTSLKDLTPYIVEGASIILNGNIYQPGERFTTKDVLDFSSDGGGVCREILEAPQRHTIMARFSNGGASKSVGDPLVVGYWYYAISGTINYNGVEYFQKSFKAIDTNSFTTSDGGVLIEAFTNEEYQHYEPGIAFSSNNVGNVRTGQILRGNGDPDYIRGNVFEFPINARFIQLKYIIRVKNLKP